MTEGIAVDELYSPLLCINVLQRFESESHHFSVAVRCRKSEIVQAL